MGRLRLNLDILSPERLTPFNLAATALGAVLLALLGSGVGLLVDVAFDTEHAWWIGGLTTSVLGTIVLTGIISYEKD